MVENREEKSPEERVWGLRDSIVQRLIEKGGNPDTPAKLVGVDVVQVVGNEENFAFLYLGANKEWDFRYFGGVNEVSNPDINELLRQFALVREPDFFKIIDDFWSGRSDKGEELIIRDSRMKEREKQYVLENKPRLISEFTSSLESTLQNLS
jgi:hypothetical protein